MTKIAICDDEQPIREYLKSLTEKSYPGFTGSPVWQRRGTVTRSDIL